MVKGCSKSKSQRDCWKLMAETPPGWGWLMKCWWNINFLKNAHSCWPNSVWGSIDSVTQITVNLKPSMSFQLTNVKSANGHKCGQWHWEFEIRSRNVRGSSFLLISNPRNIKIYAILFMFRTVWVNFMGNKRCIIILVQRGILIWRLWSHLEHNYMQLLTRCIPKSSKTLNTIIQSCVPMMAQ